MRLQPMHIGHLELISESSKLGQNTTILIFNTETQDENNPLSEQEKIKILKKTIEIENLKNIKIISMPYYKENKKRFEFIEQNIKLTEKSLIVSGNKFIQTEFQKLGFKIRTPQEILGKLKNISGTKIRKLIIEKKEYKHFLSSGTIYYHNKLD